MKEHDRDGRATRPWPRFMTARVAADYADTSPWTIRRNVRACGRRGRSFVYAIEDVERWMRGQPIATRPFADDETPRRKPAPAETSIGRIRSLARHGASTEGDDLDLDPDDTKMAS